MIHTVRGVSKKQSDPNRVDLKNYGGDHAKESYQERLKKEMEKGKAKTKTQKATTKTKGGASL